MQTFSGDTLYGQTIVCSCGKTHQVEPQRVIYEEGALSLLPDLLSACASGRRAIVLMDRRTREVAGRQAAELMRAAGWEAGEVIVQDPPAGGWPACDDLTHNRLRRQIGAAEVVVAVGSGVLTDLGKWIASDLEVPCVAVATAASMNGYASFNVAATLKGVKSLLRARAPYAVLAEPAIIRDAPYEMTASGLGDILAKSVSSADWRMNHLLFGDHFCERSVSLIAEIEPLYLNHPQDLKERKAEAIAALFHGLLLTGVAMTMAEGSAPASGGEHLVSHTLDMMSSLDGVPHDLHGRQVGVGTVLAAELYRRVVGLESPTFASPPAEIDRDFWGPLSEEVAARYSQKWGRLKEAAEALSRRDTWDRLREEVQPYLRPPEVIRDCLRQAGAAYRAEDIGCSRHRLLQALRHAHEPRARFTVIDLARLTGLLPAAAQELVEEWA